MRVFLYVLLVSSILFTSGCVACGDEAEPIEFDNFGVVVGLDLGLCPCCGDLVFNLEDSAPPFRIKEYPTEFEDLIEECADFQYIRIDEFEKIE